MKIDSPKSLNSQTSDEDDLDEELYSDYAFGVSGVSTMRAFTFLKRSDTSRI